MKPIIPFAILSVLAAIEAKAQVIVEFGPSGELVMLDPRATTGADTSGLRAFEVETPHVRLFDEAGPSEKVFEMESVETLVFDRGSTEERAFAIPEEPTIPDPVALAEPEKIDDVIPDTFPQPVLETSPAITPAQPIIVEPARLETLLRTEPVSFQSITFETGSAVLHPEAYTQLDGIAAALRRDPNLKIEVIGHTDSQGEIGYNQHLSERRAEAVVQALVDSYGVKKERLFSSGRGESEPVDSNSTADGRKNNRRVELVGR